MRLENKVAIISGGSRGMGAFEAALFVQEGAKVIIGDVRDEEGRDLAKHIGSNAVYMHLDVTSERDWAAVVKEATDRYGKLDILVNNAGVSARGTIEETSVDDWDRVMGINAKGVFLGTKAALPEMRRTGGGSIINISSQLGIVGSSFASGAAYQASKGAVRLFTKATAMQYASDGIRANSVHPGPVDTDMMASGQSTAYLPSIPIGRYGEPDEVAYGVLFLASDEASFMTGSELVIDGGWTAQ